ncbi:thiamine-phosphate kinase [Myxococcota bacterium]|nr:thiamine-phosphate kinase [Myxococcota bacterium]
MPDDPLPDEHRLLAIIGAALARAGRPADLTDDCAALAGQTALVTTDTLVEGVHFDLALDTPAQVGVQAAVQNLSDLAASGGSAGWLVWSLCLGPAHRTEAFVAGLTDGFATTAARFGASVVGGNLSRTPGPLVVAVTAGGPLAGARPLTRAGARPGHGVYVTGPLGDAALGVEDARARAARHAWRPHLAEAARLAVTPGVGACMDVSDGLLLDAGRLAAASGVTLALTAAAVPVGPACGALGDPARARRLALTGGEDYVLLFTAEAPPADLVAHRIGTVADGPAQVLVDGAVPAGARGFDHFAPLESAR